MDKPYCGRICCLPNNMGGRLHCNPNCTECNPIPVQTDIQYIALVLSDVVAFLIDRKLANTTQTDGNAVVDKLRAIANYKEVKE